MNLRKKSIDAIVSYYKNDFDRDSLISHEDIFMDTFNGKSNRGIVHSSLQVLIY